MMKFTKEYNLKILTLLLGVVLLLSNITYAGLNPSENSYLRNQLLISNKEEQPRIYCCAFAIAIGASLREGVSKPIDGITKIVEDWSEILEAEGIEWSFDKENKNIWVYHKEQDIYLEIDRDGVVRGKDRYAFREAMHAIGEIDRNVEPLTEGTSGFLTFPGPIVGDNAGPGYLTFSNIPGSGTMALMEQKLRSFGLENIADNDEAVKIIVKLNNHIISREEAESRLKKIGIGISSKLSNFLDTLFTTPPAVTSDRGMFRKLLGLARQKSKFPVRDGVVKKDVAMESLEFNIEAVKNIVRRSLSGELELLSDECFNGFRRANAMLTNSYHTNMVVNKDGDGILIVGPKLSGKTFLTHLFQELNSDYYFMADDSVYLVYPFDHEKYQPNYAGPLYAFPLYSKENRYEFRSLGSGTKDKLRSAIRKAEPDLIQIKLVIILKPVENIKGPAYYLKEERLDERVKLFKDPYDTFWNKFNEMLSIAPFLVVYLTPETTIESYRKVVRVVSEDFSKKKNKDQSETTHGGQTKDDLTERNTINLEEEIGKFISIVSGFTSFYSEHVCNFCLRELDTKYHDEFYDIIYPFVYETGHFVEDAELLSDVESILKRLKEGIAKKDMSLEILIPELKQAMVYIDRFFTIVQYHADKKFIEIYHRSLSRVGIGESKSGKWIRAARFKRTLGKFFTKHPEFKETYRSSMERYYEYLKGQIEKLYEIIDALEKSKLYVPQTISTKLTGIAEMTDL